MAQEFSFDVVSKVDLQEVSNAVQQASKEIATRFDFRGSKSKIEWNEKDLALTLTSDDEHKLKSVVDILETRLVKRGVAVKSLDYGKVEPAAMGTVRQVVKVQQGIASEKAKEIEAELRRARYSTSYDEKAAIGRRYRRQDEVGTPFCVTVDGDTLADDTVTVRHRDSMAQERVKTADLRACLDEAVRAWRRPERASARTSAG